MPNDKSSRRGTLDESTLANERMGNNQLQGNDQAEVRNQRHAAAGERNEADEDVVESFEKLDKDKRAQRELGKGARQGR